MERQRKETRRDLSALNTTSPRLAYPKTHSPSVSQVLHVSPDPIMSPTRSTTSRDSAAGQQARVRQPQSKQEHVSAGVAPVVEGALRGVDVDSRLSAPVRVRGSTVRD